MNAWSRAFRDDVLAGKIAQVQEAQRLLLADGYQFVGYHGCNAATMSALVPDRFDVTKIGSGAGIARGKGFYVARNRQRAEDYADESTQAGDPQPPRYETPRKPGSAGEQVVLRVYAKGFNGMRNGVHLDWGVQSRAGDPNGDLNVTSAAGQNVNACALDLEVVFRPEVYGKLGAIPSLGVDQDRAHLDLELANWPAHEGHDPAAQLGSRPRRYSIA